MPRPLLFLGDASYSIYLVHFLVLSLVAKVLLHRALHIMPPVAAELGFEQLAGPRGVADDLKKLPGVSPAIEKQLNDLGIFHLTQIAEFNEKAAHKVGEEVGLPGRVDGWIKKAKELTAE